MGRKREIYILLTHSGSLLSKFIGIYTKEPYTHVSIALDRDLNEVYSFGRLYPSNPIYGGLSGKISQMGPLVGFQRLVVPYIP